MGGSPPPEELVLHDVRLNEADFSGRRFSYVSVAGSRLEAVDFSRVRMTQGGLGGGFSSSEYRECVFDGATIRGVVPGRSTFVRCSFRDVKIYNFRCFEAQFIDCVFSGTLNKVTFTATPVHAEKLGRDVNEYRGNDFTGATLRDVSFRGGIDLDQQRLPDGDDYIIVRNAPTVLPYVRGRIRCWSDDEERGGANDVLSALESNVSTGQTDLFVARSLLGKTPVVAGKLAELLLGQA